MKKHVQCHFYTLWKCATLFYQTAMKHLANVLITFTTSTLIILDGHRSLTGTYAPLCLTIRDDELLPLHARVGAVAMFPCSTTAFKVCKGILIVRLIRAVFQGLQEEKRKKKQWYIFLYLSHYHELKHKLGSMVKAPMEFTTIWKPGL